MNNAKVERDLPEIKIRLEYPTEEMCEIALRLHELSNQSNPIRIEASLT